MVEGEHTGASSRICSLHHVNKQFRLVLIRACKNYAKKYKKINSVDVSEEHTPSERKAKASSKARTGPQPSTSRSSTGISP